MDIPNSLSEVDDLVTISSINQYTYCPRRCSLIYLEMSFAENKYTLQGEEDHENADSIGWETTEGARCERALPLWSDKFGLVGRADIVEFREDGTIYPVEYKHGKMKAWLNDDLQLCAQAACLEEMFDVKITSGAIYHVSSRHRREVMINDELMEKMAETIIAIRALLHSELSPPPLNNQKCRDCSLYDVCIPELAMQSLITKLSSDLYKISDKEDMA
jgi:CRISPR-associated exonuclease Cas4